ncbi:MAG: thioesterase family protein [Caulobacteraceae bacterium]|nr:thioesterase family protein [Caulobacteraceae bacterium]
MTALLALEPAGPDRFLAPGLEGEARRSFGGHLVGQALAAATGTVDPQRRVHSLHAYFIRSGVTTIPTEFVVTPDSDGSNLSFRRVAAVQDGQVLITLSASFQAPHDGDEHQIAMPEAPPPETLDDDFLRAERMAAIPPEALALVRRASPLQFRSPWPEQRLGTGPAPALQNFWFRTAAPFEGDQAFHRIVLAYASDVMLLGAGLMPHGMRWFDGQARISSIDHALWIHRDVRMDDWLFYTQESPWSGEGRNFNRGHIFDRAGRLIATVAQEGLMRRPQPAA